MKAHDNPFQAGNSTCVSSVNSNKHQERIEERQRITGLGMSLTESGHMCTPRISRQAFHSYIKQHGLWEYWKERRKEQRENEMRDMNKNAYQRLADTLTNYMYTMTADMRLPYQQAVESRFKTRRCPRNIHLKNLIKLFEIYHDLREQGKRKSFRKLAELSGMSAMSTRGHLMKVGEKSMFWQYTRRRALPRRYEQ